LSRRLEDASGSARPAEVLKKKRRRKKEKGKEAIAGSEAASLGKLCFRRDPHMLFCCPLS
jgi:hypothetical protein